MTTDDSTEYKSEPEELTAEELQLTLDAGHELARIAAVLKELDIIYNDAYGAPEENPFVRFMERDRSKVARTLYARQEELRQMLLDLG